jgi:hypothetical protein
MSTLSEAKLYREKAEQCRRLAAAATRPEVIAALKRLGAEFEAQASKLDNRRVVGGAKRAP